MRSDGQSACEIYNLACDHEMTVRAFLFSIADAMGWKRPAFFLPYAAARKLRRVIRRFERLSGRSRVALLRRYGFQLFTQNLRFDNSRIKTLGYSPGVGHSEAVSRVAQWLRENDLATSISGKEGSG
jgi:nucleoside-diphosphate-sugar epimerase